MSPPSRSLHLLSLQCWPLHHHNYNHIRPLTAPFPQIGHAFRNILSPKTDGHLGSTPEYLFLKKVTSVYFRKMIIYVGTVSTIASREGQGRAGQGRARNNRQTITVILNRVCSIHSQLPWPQTVIQIWTPITEAEHESHYSKHSECDKQNTGKYNCSNCRHRGATEFHLMYKWPPRTISRTGCWGDEAVLLHNEKLHSFYSSPNSIMVIRLRRMRWENHWRAEKCIQTFSRKRTITRPRRRW
jgi:hypothetical protein